MEVGTGAAGWRRPADVHEVHEDGEPPPVRGFAVGVAMRGRCDLVWRARSADGTAERARVVLLLDFHWRLWMLLQTQDGAREATLACFRGAGFAKETYT